MCPSSSCEFPWQCLPPGRLSTRGTNATMRNLLRHHLAKLCGGRISHACLDLLLQLRDALAQAALLVLIDLPNRVHLLHALRAEGDLASKVRQLGLGIGVRGYICALGRLDACKAAEHRIAELRASIGHRERGAPLPALSVNHIGASVLDMPH